MKTTYLEKRGAGYRIYLLTLLYLAPYLAFTQEESPKNWALTGYVKNLQTLLFLEDDYLQDNLIHNRLNFRWFMDDAWTLRADLRSRFFWGDLVKANPFYGALTDQASNDWLDLSVVPLDHNNLVFHSVLDRLYLEYSKDNWEIRLGRQRVNWGISTVWNPNDIFNAFSFTDFDYEERPGSDAIRVKYYTGVASSVELVVKGFDDFEEAVMAGMWKFNRWGYDFQLLAGVVEQDFALGGGWAGNLGTAGFKGEATYFLPMETKGATASFAMALGIDYAFSNSLYVNIGYLYNGSGTTSAGVGGLFNFQLSARNLYPYKHAVFLQQSYPLTPLLNTSLAFIYSPVSVHPLFINPVLTYSIKENWDLDLVGQIVFNEDEGYRSPVQAIFLRTKYSF